MSGMTCRSTGRALGQTRSRAPGGNSHGARCENHAGPCDFKPVLFWGSRSTRSRMRKRPTATIARLVARTLEDRPRSGVGRQFSPGADKESDEGRNPKSDVRVPRSLRRDPAGRSGLGQRGPFAVGSDRPTHTESRSPEPSPPWPRERSRRFGSRPTNSRAGADKGRMGGGGRLDGNTGRPRCEKHTRPSELTAVLFGRCRQERLR
jgi:hypothetical protein